MINSYIAAALGLALLQHGLSGAGMLGKAGKPIAWAIVALSAFGVFIEIQPIVSDAIALAKGMAD